MVENDILETSNREKIEDMLFKHTNPTASLKAEVTQGDYKVKLFIRLGGKNIKFVNVNFSHSFFENCYLKDCVFESCNFNGCKFTNCNLTGSSFPNCNFDYASFEKTFIDNDVLASSPKFENLKQKFARSLRMNYQGLGDSDSVSKAMKVELEASEKHLLNSWFSEHIYYRSKYQGIDRIIYIFKWLYFLLQKVIWGNGESPKQLIKSGIYLWIIMTLVDTFSFKNIDSIKNYVESFVSMPGVFFGVSKPLGYSDFYLAIISMLRLIWFGLFMSLILKTYNKR